MDVDFNNLRKQTCFAYDRLATKLNNKIEVDSWGDKTIKVTPEEIQKDMDELRSLIMTLAWTFNEEDEDFRVVGDEVEPIAWFNEEKEEDNEQVG